MTLAEPSVVPAGRGRVLAGLMLTMALAAMDLTVVATAVPTIARELGGLELFPWLFAAYVLAQAVTTPIYGRLADLYGRKPIFVVSILLFLLGSVLAGFAWSMVALIVARGVQGLGAGGVQPIVQTVAGDLYSVRERGRIQALIGSVWATAALIGPLTGGLFSEYVSWRWIFFVNIPIGVAALAMIVANLHEPELVRRRHRLDFGGAALLVAGTGLLIFGLLTGGVDWAWNSPQSICIFLGGALGLAAFVWQERRAPEPMLPGWVFGRRVLVGASLGSLLVGVLVTGFSAFVPVFVQGALGAGPVTAGFVAAAASLGWPITAALSSFVYLRIGFRSTALVGAVICVGGVAILVGETQETPLWEPALGCFILGIGLGLMASSLTVGVQSVVEWRRRGVVTGSYMFMRWIGQAVGAAVFGAVANATLASWFAGAPAAVADELPSDVDAAASVLGGKAVTLSTEAAGYVRSGVELAMQRVYVALFIAAIVGVAVLFVLPRHFVALSFAEDDDGEAVEAA